MRPRDCRPRRAWHEETGANAYRATPDADGNWAARTRVAERAVVATLGAKSAIRRRTKLPAPWYSGSRVGLAVAELPCCVKTKLPSGNLLEDFSRIRSLDACPSRGDSAGHPERWASSTAGPKPDRRALRDHPAPGRRYANMCIGCDRFHEECSSLSRQRASGAASSAAAQLVAVAQDIPLVSAIDMRRPPRVLRRSARACAGPRVNDRRQARARPCLERVAATRRPTVHRVGRRGSERR